VQQNVQITYTLHKAVTNIIQRSKWILIKIVENTLKKWKQNQNKMSMAKATGPFRDSQAPSWLSGPRTDATAEPPSLIGPAITPRLSPEKYRIRYSIEYCSPKKYILWLICNANSQKKIRFDRLFSLIMFAYYTKLRSHN
jgi:hypothetical protein